MNKRDLSQIGELIDERIDKAFDKRLTPIEEELKRHGVMLEEHSKLLKQQGKMLRSLKRNQDTMLNMLDGEQMKQSKRLARVEEHLGISSN